MSITALPEGTIRRLGSAPIINSPVLLLKELLDNAIDSGATSIEALVSPNTVDKIEVRDNGHGIRVSDLHHLGRPGHTSKLRSFEELGTLGGSTLGFRGAALASANALAHVSLTTRATSEPVGTAVSLAEGGGIGTQRHVGAPVGTTVCVSSLFSSLPVRLQVAVKEAPKSLDKMKDLLRSYALARPSIKLRFSVLKKPNLSWSYAPPLNAGVRDAAMQLFGIELVSQCSFHIFPSEGPRAEAETRSVQGDPGLPSEEEGRLVFESLLPSLKADPRKINKGCFLSVDGRPISPARGTARKLSSIFRRRLGNYFAQSHSGDILHDPFIALNIRCPPGSYDVNIEPSKEDVLFREERHLLDLFESFLSSVYPASEVDMASALDDLDDHDDGVSCDDLSRQIQLKSDQDPAALLDDDVGGKGNGQLSKEAMNPWSIAKLVGTNRRDKPLADGPGQKIHQEVHLRPSESEGSTASDKRPLEPPNRHTRDNKPQLQATPPQDISPQVNLGAAAKSTWSSGDHDRPCRSRGLQSPPTSSPHDSVFDEPSPTERLRRRHRAGLNRLAQSQISFDRNNRRQRHHKRIELDGDHQLSEPSSSQRHKKNSAWTSPLGLEPARSRSAYPAETEPRRGRPISQASLSRPFPSPSAAGIGILTPVRRRLGSGGERPQPTDPGVRPIEPEGPMTSNTRKKPMGMKTEQLPLETIPNDSRTCGLSFTVTIDACQLARLLVEAAKHDKWLFDGQLMGAFEDGKEPEDTATLLEPLLAQITGRLTAKA
ncbi:uncharacterized protein THITE_2154204 [Thermothielavioides terrestris NRRL 8126]|uniref:DNA mismatch repair protein S5 domain-containing protein n=1 Tax=Thermothielavioides terrestris (strain ATCC 38088 / NRRL 8126) TaxID=578455 RepID=G2R1Z2_THETT|nr:uncharacterized protein THITE_2154204 [Thermothielavioides terrestris NRRL 8126]AEO65773.1 hypothetical protein THITE_2154204 [Thermothielavioides terrestris NRRL 8126]